MKRTVTIFDPLRLGPLSEPGDLPELTRARLRGRLKSRGAAWKTAVPAARQAGGLSAVTGEDACLPRNALFKRPLKLPR